jgi:hypothetical protein
MDDDATLRERRCAELTEHGLASMAGGDHPSAAEWLGAACETWPEHFGTWLNLGLARKAAGDWAGSRTAFLAAWSRLPADVATGQYTALLWNLGLLATLQRDWLRARLAWNTLGFPSQVRCEQPPSIPLGKAFVVLPGRDEPVPGTRVDPVRLVPDVPLRADGAACVVVHDAQRLGALDVAGAPWPVFPALALQ